MKLVADFDDFLRDKVNLNDSRLQLLDASYEAIKNFLRGSDYQGKIASFYKHGSWAHKTIVRPQEGGEFDADVIVFLRPVDGWSAADYVNRLADVFKASPIYKDKVRVYSHCVTIEYAGERKMDLAPCVTSRLREGTLEVCNRNNNTFQTTEPILYTKWLNTQNSYCGKNSLRKTTRLVKYLRDFKGTFTCPSFLLTTLLGNRVSEGDTTSESFSDVPSALQTLVGRLDDWLQLNAAVPDVANPALPSEDQAANWTLEQYTNFKNQIQRYRTWIDEAYTEVDVDKSRVKWQKIFGDSFGVVKKSELREATQAGGGCDEVDLLRKSGLSSLPDSILKPTWRSIPLWSQDLVQRRVAITAMLIAQGGGGKMRVFSGVPLEPENSIVFSSWLGGVAPPGEFETQWRVTNTGGVAERRRQLRGQFYGSDTPHKRVEDLSYRGVHMVEAFVIRTSDRKLVGMSDPFYVVVE